MLERGKMAGESDGKMSVKMGLAEWGMGGEWG